MLTSEDYKTFMRMASKGLSGVPDKTLHELSAVCSHPRDALDMLASIGPLAIHTVCLAAAATIETELERRRRER